MNTNKNKCMVCLLPIRCLIFALTFVVGAIMTKQKTDDISNWWSIAASIVNIVTILILVYVAKKNKSSYRELINYQKGKTKAKQIIGISVLVLVVGMSGMYVAGYICYGIIPYAAPMMITPIPVWLAVIDVATVIQILATSTISGLYEMMC